MLVPQTLGQDADASSDRGHTGQTMNQPWSSLAVPPDAIIGVLNAVFQRWPDPGTSIMKATIPGNPLTNRMHRGMAVARPFPAGCREKRQIGREDRRKIDMIRRAAGSEPC